MSHGRVREWTLKQMGEFEARSYGGMADEYVGK